MKVSKFYIFFIAGLIVILSSTAYLVKTQQMWGSRETSKQATKIQDHSKVIKFNHKVLDRYTHI